MTDQPQMDPELERLHRAALRDPAATAELERRARARTGRHRAITTPSDLHRATADAQGFYFGYHSANDHEVVPVWRARDGREVRVNLVSPTPLDPALYTNHPVYVGQVVKFLRLEPA